MALAVIGFGSNLGDGRQLLMSGWKSLTQAVGVRGLRFSPLFLSAPVGMTSQAHFTNGVGLVETELTPLTLLHLLLRIEAEHGRRRDVTRSGYQDRFLDLDLLYFGEMICSLPELTLPHPAIRDRLFVLAPLLEVAPELVDPESGLCVRQMYQELCKRMQQRALPVQTIVRIEQSE